MSGEPGSPSASPSRQPRRLREPLSMKERDSPRSSAGLPSAPSSSPSSCRRDFRLDCRERTSGECRGSGELELPSPPSPSPPFHRVDFPLPW